MTTTLHIENTVRDYASWLQAFDKFERFRTDNGVQSYSICRRASDPSEIVIDLEFGSTRGGGGVRTQAPADLEHAAVHRAAGLPRSTRTPRAGASPSPRREPAVGRGGGGCRRKSPPALAAFRPWGIQ